MKNHKTNSYLKQPYQTWLIIVTCVAFVLNSCKKDIHSDTSSNINNPVVQQAKTWYESAYPVNSKISIQSLHDSSNLSQIIKPDWENANAYARTQQQVLEIPLDAAVQLHSSLKNMNSGLVTDKAKSRSSFLLLKDGQNYVAYVMTVIADPAYLKNDLTKLDHDKYNKRDSDFSGTVLYSTPKGKFISGWFYEKGRIIKAISTAGNSTTSKGDNKTVQSLQTNNLQQDCTDWYQISEANGEVVAVTYLGTTCDWVNGDGSSSGGAPPASSGGGGGGNGGTPPSPIPCPESISDKTQIQSTGGHLTINKNVQQPPGDGDGTFPPPTYPPVPPPSPCVVTVSIPPMDIKDSLNAKYDCARQLITALPNLNTNIARLIFQAFGSTTGPSITFLDGDPAHFAANSKEDGYTDGDKIYINPSVLSNSTNEYRLVTFYHEALHAYFNLEIATLTKDGFIAKYPAIKVVDRPNFSGNVTDPYDFYFDEGTVMTKLANDVQHRTMADYFIDNLRDAILAYNPNFPIDKATALARYGIFNDTSIVAANNAERDVTKGESVGTKCP